MCQIASLRRILLWWTTNGHASSLLRILLARCSIYTCIHLRTASSCWVSLVLLIALIWPSSRLRILLLPGSVVVVILVALIILMPIMASLLITLVCSIAQVSILVLLLLLHRR